MVKAAQCHGKARERKGSARKEKGRAAETERKKKMGMERMREFTLWRIFDFMKTKIKKRITIRTRSPYLLIKAKVILIKIISYVYIFCQYVLLYILKNK